MKISFDPKHDVLYIKFSEEKIADTIEVDDGVLIDYGGRADSRNRDHWGIKPDESQPP
jgi:hypothetical protein